MRLAKTSSISAKFEILTCKNFSFHGNLNDRNNIDKNCYLEDKLSMEKSKCKLQINFEMQRIWTFV